eukprot:287023-Pelagomonas_calceolata.AAC.1
MAVWRVRFSLFCCKMVEVLCLVDGKGCEQGLNRSDKTKLLFQVTPLVADSPRIVVVAVRRHDFCAADFKCYLILHLEE